MSADEQRIRELAHQIWLAEGCPKDQARRHLALIHIPQPTRPY